MGVYSELCGFALAQRACDELRGDADRSRPRATASGPAAPVGRASIGGWRRTMPRRICYGRRCWRSRA